MAKNKSEKRIKMAKVQNEDENDVKRLIIIIIGLIIAIILVYFLTRIFVTKDLLNKEEEKTFQAGSVNYNTTLIGSMFNKPEEEYYVMIIDTSKSDYVYYTGTVSNYKKNEDALKVYLADLDNALNKNYQSTNSNLKTEDLTKFQVSKPSLIKIKNKKVVETYDTESEISKVLKYVEPEEEDTAE